MTNYTQEWDLEGNLNTSGVYIVRYIEQSFKDYFPQYSEFHPFNSGYSSNAYFEEDFFCLEIKEIISHMPHAGTLKDQILIADCKEIFKRNKFPEFVDVLSGLEKHKIDHSKFVYIGQLNGNKLSWLHIQQQVVSFLNECVVPRILALNIKRVNDAIPTPPSYDTTTILNNTYVLESENGMSQGSAFHVKGVGIITCDHCIRDENSGKIFDDLVLFRGNDHGKKFPVEVLKFNKDLDVAILKVDSDVLSEGLEIGNSDKLNQMDHIAVAGFPNYNYGDNGIFSPGLIVGFRTYSGIRHLLVNSPLISGNSGGPAIDKENKVIGIAVTGADKMSNAHLTEKHGIIPIDVINLI